MNTVKIGVDARPLAHPGTGIFRYTLELLSRMCRMGGQWYLYSPVSYDIDLVSLPNVHHRIGHLSARLRAGQLAHALIPIWARRDSIGTFWGPRHQIPALIPHSVNAVVTIHDLVFLDCAETMRFPGKQIEGFFTPRAMARADCIAVVSDFTYRRLVENYPQFADKVVIIPGASLLQSTVSPCESHLGGVPKSDYFLFVGTLEPRKNLPRILRAFRRFATETPSQLSLKIAGNTGWGGQDIAGMVDELGLASRVQLLGRVADEHLPELYQNAHTLLMPSLYEGFGLPVIEALSCDVPVVTSRESAMAEVAGPAAHYVDPLSEEEIFQAMRMMVFDEDKYRKLKKEARDRVDIYDWNRSAEMLFSRLGSRTLSKR
ncbi:MAG: glycosyltransferase family 1 protein [Pseudomonadota bacterium]